LTQQIHSLVASQATLQQELAHVRAFSQQSQLSMPVIQTGNTTKSQVAAPTSPRPPASETREETEFIGTWDGQYGRWVHDPLLDTWSIVEPMSKGQHSRYFDKEPPPHWNGLHPEKTWKKYKLELEQWLATTDIPKENKELRFGKV
jgi:hypothetical protein